MKFHILANSFCNKLKETTSLGRKRTMYTATISAANLPYGIDMACNARRPSLTGDAVKAMRNTIETAPETFSERNKGLTIICDKLYIDKHDPHKLAVHITRDVDGLADGGHTMMVLDQYRNNPKYTANFNNVSVKVTFLVGYAQEEAQQIAEGHNVQKKQWQESIKYLQGEMRMLEAVATSKGMRRQVAFYENDEHATGLYRARDLVAMMNLVQKRSRKDKKRSSKPPCYANIAGLVKHYKDADFKFLLKRLPELVILHNMIAKEYGALISKPRSIQLAGLKLVNTVSYNGALLPVEMSSLFWHPIVRAISENMDDKYNWVNNGKVIAFDKLVKKIDFTAVIEEYFDYVTSGVKNAAVSGIQFNASMQLSLNEDYWNVAKNIVRDNTL